MPVTPTNFDDMETQNVTWLAETATGIAADVGRFSDITVQATGTGTVTLTGSIDNINYVALKATTGAAISLTASTFDMAVILEHPRWIKAVVTGGTANVYLFGSGNR